MAQKLGELTQNQVKRTQSLIHSQPLKTEKCDLAIQEEHSKTDKIAIATELGKCLLVQRTYGSQGGDTQKMMAVFLGDLQGYNPEQILGAIQKWRLVSQQFPTPSDIISILNPVPKFDYAVYSRLIKKKDGFENLNGKEWAYIRAYEKNAMEGI